MSFDKISIIVPCRNEENYISNFIDSLVLTDYPKELIEIFIVDGMSTDQTIKIVNEYSKKFNFIKLLTNENRTVPFALNDGIQKASGEYIIRLDAHCQIPPNYFTALISSAKKLKADNVGTVWNTDVKNKNRKSNAIKKVLSNRFGVGNSYFRIGIDHIKEVDTVPFGCFKKDVFDRVGIFNPKLDRDQDIELNKRIKRAGGKVFLIPHISSTYFARETYRALAQNNFATGLWNILTIYITKQHDSLSIRHFIPLFFLLSLILPLLMMFINPNVGFVSAASFISYLSLISIVSFKINDKSTSFSHIFFSFLILHFSYGSGSLVGLFRFDYLKK